MKDLKQLLKTFKTVLKETATTFNIPEHAVNRERFKYINAGRIVYADLHLLGGYQKVKEYLYPSPKGGDEASRKAMQQLLKSIGGAK